MRLASDRCELARAAQRPAAPLHLTFKWRDLERCSVRQRARVNSRNRSAISIARSHCLRKRQGLRNHQDLEPARATKTSGLKARNPNVQISRDYRETSGQKRLPFNKRIKFDRAFCQSQGASPVIKIRIRHSAYLLCRQRVPSVLFFVMRFPERERL
jgi:hypothetical protein